MTWEEFKLAVDEKLKELGEPNPEINYIDFLNSCHVDEIRIDPVMGLSIT